MTVLLLFLSVYFIRKMIVKHQERAQRNRILREKRMSALEREQARQRKEQEKLLKEQERQAKEQERQAAKLAKHEEMIMKLEQRVCDAERDIDFNREQIRRLHLLLHIKQSERDAAIYQGSEWQKHHKKIITLENQIHSAQKRIDKAQADKYFCEQKLSA